MKPLPIPSTLDEAVDQMLSGMTDADKAAYKLEPEDFPGLRFHFSGGMAMRNGWGLWHGVTGVSKWLRDRHIYPGDDQSCTIYRALWRRLHGLSIGDEWLAEEAAHYEQFWKDTAGLTWDMKPLTIVSTPKEWSIFVKRANKTN